MLSILHQEYFCTDMNKVSYYGYSFIDNSFKDYLVNKVKPKLDDEDWTQELLNTAVEVTGFSADNFAGIFENRGSYSCWRIGEVVAECVLEDSGKARFYYDSCRDLKNPNAHNTGADIVGFCDINDETLFLFGEVKTSNSPSAPPSVVYGRTGMIEQLTDLQVKEDKRNNLIKWMTSKIKLLPEKFKSDLGKALCAYTKSKRKKVQLVGVLVRDTHPDELDLKNRAKVLEETASPLIGVWLFALYTGVSMEKDAWISIMNGGATCDS
ncbi:hypothetical protein [Thermoanaerobacterium sp. RBIITD]|uniref:hypothetical protein n=1 Tax=Thermoanaerobacterium sp. RBIITD TaxID=1550240 RepID=UPI000BB77C8B|nr:hypothetical protein [Thermoanaerobacterium sp. RBIITD]SNX54498.1 hypothetical protein SAMN05660242_2191 [Thermoanaerobacterium sp. RBIITD]